MREIKFRAWDKEIGVMHKSSDLDVSEDYFTAFDSGVMHLYHVNSIGDYTELEIMQYTGLKDKSGTEIYEGDILSVDSTGTALGDKFYEGFQGYDSKIIVVDIRYASFRKYTDKLTVTDNIYENPKLI